MTDTLYLVGVDEFQEFWQAFQEKFPSCLISDVSPSPEEPRVEVEVDDFGVDAYWEFLLLEGWGVRSLGLRMMSEGDSAGFLWVYNKVAREKGWSERNETYKPPPEEIDVRHHRKRRRR